ncbi:MAG: hypothetical protein JNL82_41725 [Myxococcales bacterium]|nr:hypothetical protein [Myxococcales bacterium]
MGLLRRSCRNVYMGLLTLVLSATEAQAGNGVHPRTPVVWPEHACMTIIDRTDSSELVLNYTIPYEDLRPANAVDEVASSRTHQFLAFCRGHSVQEPLPVWLSTADVDEAAALGIVEPNDLTLEDVFDTSMEWQDCLVRITPDDARRSITFAAAAEPVVWDTAGLPIGTYVVNGYTWEPVFNIFSLRNGVVKVVDDPDLAASPPALAISNAEGEEIVWETEALTVYGCASAMDGSTITGYWAQTDNGLPLVWNAFEPDSPVVGDTFELLFKPPPETASKLVALKVEITDPMDRTFDAHMDLLVSVLPGSPPSTDTGGECDGSGFIGDPACTTGGMSSESDSSNTEISGNPLTTDGPPVPTSDVDSDGSSSEGTSVASGQMPGAGEGCGGCGISQPTAPLAWLGLGIFMRRRRSSRRSRLVSSTVSTAP